MSGNSGVTSSSETAYHWYAKNVGKVKQFYQGRTVELVNAIINNRGPSSRSSALSLKSSHQLSSLESSLKPFSLSQKIAEDIKRVI